MIFISFLFYISSIFSLVWYSSRTNYGIRVFLFVLLFYALAPILEFKEFKFFSIYINYEYRADVFLLYSMIMIIALILSMLIDKMELSEKIDLGSLNWLWYLSLFAFFNELFFNFDDLINKTKSERIATLNEQVKNLYFFTIPAVEFLVGFAVMDRGKFFSPKKIAGILAIIYSLTAGVRHVLFAYVILVFLKRNSKALFLFLALFFTFAGNFSEVFKLILAILINEKNVDYVLLNSIIDFYFNQFGVSNEQKAILSNLLIKLDGGVPVEFDLLSSFYVLPFFFQVVQWFDLGLIQPAEVIGEYVGVGLGQGTAYNIVLSAIESPFIVLIFFILLISLSKIFTNSVFSVLLVGVLQSMMRNDYTYTSYLLWKLLFLIIGCYLLKKISFKNAAVKFYLNK